MASGYFYSWFLLFVSPSRHETMGSNWQRIGLGLVVAFLSITIFTLIIYHAIDSTLTIDSTTLGMLVLLSTVLLLPFSRKIVMPTSYDGLSGLYQVVEQAMQAGVPQLDGSNVSDAHLKRVSDDATKLSTTNQKQAAIYLKDQLEREVDLTYIKTGLTPFQRYSQRVISMRREGLITEGIFISLTKAHRELDKMSSADVVSSIDVQKLIPTIIGLMSKLEGMREEMGKGSTPR